MEKKSFRETREKATQATVCQRGPSDIGGWERDTAWRREVRRARGWAALQLALPHGHPMADYVSERAGW